MATTTIDVPYQGVVRLTYVDPLLFDWIFDVRAAATGDNATTYTTNTQDNSAVRASYQTGRLGNIGVCSRTFLFFDDIFALTEFGTVTAATLKVYNGGSATSTRTIICESYAWGSNGSSSTLVDTDYSEINYYGTGTYSTEKTSWSGSNYNDFVLDASCIADINGYGYLNCAVIEYDYDFLADYPTTGTIFNAPIEFLDPTNKIKLEITYTPGGYPNKVIGVAGASIATVDGIGTVLSIPQLSKVIGV
jgi:hypothetical protein